MALDILIQRISDEANREASAIVKQAEAEAADILKQSKEQTTEMITSIHQKGEKNRLRVQERILAAARREARMCLTNAKEEIITECVEAVKNRLKHLPTKDYKKYVNSMLKNATTNLQDMYLIGTRKEDSAIAEQHNLDYKGTQPGIGGVRLISNDNAIEVDLTFASLLKQKKNELRILISRNLFENHD